ncbi:type IV pilus assembly protein PilM [Nocardioides sp. MAHUQ-72]|uniref:type IV pilus assembly protein PilM n=1 Tax=unclassified Nocardioides TaxID=2615069 RepID=UPI003616AEE0
MARTLVGLDIGSTGVRAAELVPGRRRSTLRRFASVPLAPGVVRSGIVVDGEALTAALKELWSKGRFGSKEVSLAIANSGVMVRQMVLDWMPPADFRQALRYQVQDALPMPVDDANLDYHLLDELELAEGDEDPRRVARILLVAAAREVVDPFVDAVRGAGLRTRGVDLLPFALVRARTPGGLDPAGEAEAIVDIGSDVVSVVVHAGGVPRYVRIIPGVGGDSITQAVANRYQWTWEDAERTKVFVGLPGHARLDESQRATVAPRHDGLDHPAQQVVVRAATDLVGEIGTTLDFYRASAIEAAGEAAAPTEVARVVLAGSGARLAGLRELLEEKVGVPVERYDVMAHVKAAHGARLDAGDEGVLAVAAGLCAGAAR